jgi:polysaccharide export outer membrane protein
LKSIFFYNGIFYLFLGVFISSCVSYKQNILFQVPEGYALSQEINTAEKNYIIQKYDHLEADVFTNSGEKIIDPEFQSISGQANQSSAPVKPTYFINADGVSKFPMIGEIKLEGLTIREAEEIMQQAYAKFYTDAYVVLNCTNKRVIVLGATGGQVIPLDNENTHLVEVLALAKGLSTDAKAQNIRVLRGDQVFVADLSTVDGYIKNNVLIQSGDIVYVEPIRRPLTEGLRDYGPILSVMTTLTTLVVVIIGLR